MGVHPETTRQLPLVLVALPGMDGTGDLLGPFIDALGDRDHVVAIGYPSDRSMSYDELASFVLARLPDRDFVLLGESFSGPVATLVASMRPAHLRGLVLCATFVRNPRAWATVVAPFVRFFRMSRTWARMASPFLLGVRAEDTLRARFVGTVGDMPGHVLHGRLASVLSVDVSHVLARVTVPVLYLRATRDLLVPATAGDWVREVQPDTHLVDIQGPHGLLQAVPSACALHVRAFLERVTR